MAGDVAAVYGDAQPHRHIVDTRFSKYLKITTDTKYTSLPGGRRKAKRILPSTREDMEAKDPAPLNLIIVRL